MTTQLVSTFLKTEAPTKIQLSEMRDIIPQINSGHHLMVQISREVDAPHLDMLIEMDMDVTKFTRFILKSNRDDLFDHMINNQEFLAALSQNLTFCSPYAFDRSLAIGIVPCIRDIYYAIKNEDNNKVNKLIIHGADIKGAPAQEDVFSCVLRGPALSGNTEMALLLLSLGAKPTPSCLYDTMCNKNHVLFVALLDNLELTAAVVTNIKRLSQKTSPEIKQEIEMRGLA